MATLCDFVRSYTSNSFSTAGVGQHSLVGVIKTDIIADSVFRLLLRFMDEVAALQIEHYNRKATFDWRFIVPNAGDKLKRLHPMHDDQ